ncbi:MAG: copper amine oxidase N-terminal domain-containing protein [Armatimonadota bacterium]
MRIAPYVIGLALLALSAAPLIAANEDGSAVAVLDGGRTLVPVRAVTEWLGASVQWIAGSNQIVITRAGTTVHLRPDSTAALLNGEAIVLDTPPVVLGGVTYVPARFVVESFGAMLDYDGRTLTLTAPGGRRTMELRVAVRRGEWITYRGPWFDIDYPANFRPHGYDRGPSARTWDQDGMRFQSPDGTVEFYVYSPLWSGDPHWVKLAPGEMIFDRNTGAEGSGIDAKSLSWVTVAGPRDEYTRSWLEVHQPELNVRYYFGIRYNDMAAYDRWRDEYVRFKDSLVQYAD